MQPTSTPPPWLPTREYADRGGATLHVVYPAVERTVPPPTFVGSLRIDLLRHLTPQMPDLGVLEASRPRVVGKHGWILTHDGHWLPEQSWYGRDVGRMAIPAHVPPGTALPGTSLSLASDFAGRSYGHYLLDSLSRMHLFWSAGFTLDAVDRVICHRPPSAEAARHFARLGVPPEKCVWLAEDVVWLPERLLSPSFPGSRRNYPRWVPAFLKETCGPAPTSPHRRLWIRRTGRRSVSNAIEVDRLMERHGFETYDASTAANPAEDFAAASVVVSPHGGVLADLAFCGPGTRVLELLPTDHPAPYYFTLSVAAGLEYRCLVCRSLDERSGEFRTPSASDFMVDLAELAAALDLLGSPTS